VFRCFEYEESKSANFTLVCLCLCSWSLAAEPGFSRSRALDAMIVMDRCLLQPARTPRLRDLSQKEQIRWVTDVGSSVGTPVLQAKTSSRVYTVAAVAAAGREAGWPL